jgi:hypothetical protein
MRTHLERSRERLRSAYRNRKEHPSDTRTTIKRRRSS